MKYWDLLSCSKTNQDRQTRQNPACTKALLWVKRSSVSLHHSATHRELHGPSLSNNVQQSPGTVDIFNPLDCLPPLKI